MDTHRACVYRFGPFELQAADHVLTRAGRRVALSPKAFDVLRLLVERQGHVVGKRELLDALWPDTFVEEANLSVQVAAARKALGTDGAGLIETVAKRGYRFAGTVEKVAPPHEAGGSAHVRLSVLPLRTAGGSPESAFLSFSLPDAIAGSLSELPWLVVRSPFAVRNAPAGADPAAAAAGTADAVLYGTLGEMDRVPHVRLNLVDASSGTVILSDEFPVQLPELFQLQSRIARQIARVLAPRASPPAAQPDAIPAVPVSPGAYVLYLRANQLAYETSQWTRARELYEAALGEDPHYAPAWARLARCHRVIGKFAASRDEAQRSLARAEDAFERALTLEPALPLTHSLYAQLEVDLGRAEQAMLRLIQSARARPHAAELFAGLVHALRFCGLLDWSVAAHRRARSLDPGILTSVHHTWWMKGDYDNALRETYGDIGYMPGVALAALGRERDAIAALQWRERESLDTRVAPYIASLRALLEGRRDESLRALAQAGALQADPEAIYYLARSYARLGEVGPAVREMERVVEGGFFCHETFDRDPWLAVLRENPRFVALIARARAASARAAGAFVEAGGAAIVDA